ncbi:MAG: SDR family NAD(P)-dependent oxidoreductase [Candidatus Bathyarchaeia archaeon]
MGRLDGRVVLVTGSGRGFGRAMAIAYALEGGDVIGVARTRSELEDMAGKAESMGGSVDVYTADLASAEDIYGLRDWVIDEFGRMDVMVNNAAASPWRTLEDCTIEVWDRTIAVNLRAPMLIAKAFLDAIKGQESASIINISSRSAEMGFVAEVAYCPSKYGLEGLTQCLALELQPHNVAVNSLNVSSPPGKTLKPTALTLEEAGEMPSEVRGRYAGDMDLVEAFSGAWVFLALQTGRGVTGQRFRTADLAEYLRENSWEAAEAKWRRKLTRAVYEGYEFPESVRYQTPDGGWEEVEFSF